MSVTGLLSNTHLSISASIVRAIGFSLLGEKLPRLLRLMLRQASIKSISNRESLGKGRIRLLLRMINLKRRRKSTKKTILKPKKLSYVWHYQGLKCPMSAKSVTLL